MNNNTTEENNEEDKDRLISMRQAAQMYGFSSDYLARLAKKGRLNAQRVDTVWITTPKDVEEFIRSREKRGAYKDDIDV